MKMFLAFIALCFALGANAQTKPVSPGENLANFFTAMVVGGVVYAGAIVTGQKKELCDRLRGTYDPTKNEQCPDGQWRFLFSPTPK